MSVAATQASFRASRPSRGFTLVELLVAIVILTLLMSASLGAVRIAARSLEAAHVRAESTQIVRSANEFLRRQFAQLLPATVGQGTAKRLVFLGEEDRVRFVAPAPRQGGGAGLMIYTLQAGGKNDAGSLVLRYAPFDPGEPHPDRLRSMEMAWLADAPAGVAFEYYGSVDGRDPPA